MHRDKKLGLALGILLLGVVGAFFFRHETDSLADLPVLEDAAILDEQIAEKPITPYLTPPEFETASEQHPDLPADAPPPHPADDAFSTGPPDPIITRSNDLVGSVAASVPEHNRAWTVSAGQPPASADAAPSAQPRTHRVQPGDTLSGIAQRYLGSSTRYLEIYAANQDVLRNPNDLRVGMTIRIPAPQSAAPQNAGSPREHIAQPVSATQASPAPVESARPSSALPQNQAPPAEPARRFVPARRPLWPHRRPAAESSGMESAPAAVRSLTQIPPADFMIEPPGR